MVSGGLSAAYPMLRVEEAKIADVTGTFAVIYFGGRFMEDVETVAFLDLDGDRYTFEPYAPEFDYRIEKGVPAKEAIERAERFVSGHRSYGHSLLSRVLDEKGVVIGYELRPLYRPLMFGISDVLDVHYFLRGDTVRIYIYLKLQVERQLRSGDGTKGRED